MTIGTNTAEKLPFKVPRMSESDFRRLCDFIYAQCGINLSPAKKTMLTGRLLKRLRILGIPSFGQYYDYVSSPKGGSEELVHMIDVVTTNKTDFFREPEHFDILYNQSLPDLVHDRRESPLKKLRIWSAGCSTGEEPYSLAMVLAEFFSENQNRGDFSLLATDISSRVLAIAKEGIYPQNSVDPVPSLMKKKYLMRGNGSKKGLCRIVAELRNRVTFQRLNFNDGRQFGFKTNMDIIFCRNVIIYFDRQTQAKLFEKFYAQLVPGGYLFIGHSETLHGINDKFIPVATSVYRKPDRYK